MGKWLFVLWLPAMGWAQADILARLEKLEAENAKLRSEVAELRAKVDQLVPERLEIAERRIEEQAQTKVEAASKYPVELAGMALFNVFANSKGAGGVDTPNTASPGVNRGAGGLSFRQSMVGLRFHGPVTFFGAKVSGEAFGDFWDGTTEGTGNLAFRLRTAEARLDWERRSVSIGLMKPLISPRNPTSFATMGVTPLTSSGNLWRWQPQVRYEERVGEFKLQGALMQTSEPSGLANPALVALRRPSLELRGAWGRGERWEFGLGGHVSASHVSGQSVPSRILSVDWLAKPWEKLELSGFLFNGENVHHLGALRQSFRFLADGRVLAVRSKGGWGQASVPLTGRVTVNLFGGIHDDRDSDLVRGQNGRNRAGGANVMVQVAPNVVLGFEGLQIRSNFLGTGERRVNRYDLSLAYIF
jgi:hypothetical protein